MFGTFLSIKDDIRRATRDLTALERRQIPFAQATAVNTLAALVQNAEKKEIKTEFPTATPFTVNSVRVQRARKNNPTAVVSLGPIAEAYLAPYISGGRHFLGTKRAILNPKSIRLNRYGNIPKGKLAALKADPDVFVGSVTFKKSGETVSGVWRRPDRGTRSGKGNPDKGKKGTLGNTRKKVGKARTGLDLLIRFGESLQVTQELDWFGTAKAVLDRNAYREIKAAIDNALATAKP